MLYSMTLTAFLYEKVGVDMQGFNVLFSQRQELSGGTWCNGLGLLRVRSSQSPSCKNEMTRFPLEATTLSPRVAGADTRGDAPFA